MGKQILQTVRFVWFNVGVALLVLTLMEGVGEGYFSWRERAQSAALLADMEQRYASDAGTDQSWVRDYIRELELNPAREDEWHPYVYWRTKLYRGKYLNIDEAGIRRTWNRTASPTPGQLKVYMFGGSTLWGVGARDDFTIPSLVSKMLTTQLDSGVWVMNFGEPGYVSTQEVITLMLELRKGNVPDVVVFLDGVNDAFSAYQNGVAGIPQNESYRVAEFNSRGGFNWRQAVEKLALYRLAARLKRSRGGFQRFAPTDGRSTDALASEVVEMYLRNVSLVGALAQRYGFQAIFCWQPTVYTKKQLSQQERQWYGVLDVRSGQSFQKVNDIFRQRIRTSRIDNIYDLSGVFDEVRSTVFIDAWHITEAANERIAELMTPSVLRAVTRKERH